MTFGARLAQAMTDRGPICLGIDPHASLLEQWGLSDDLVSLERFVDTCVEALGDLAAVVKPQSAFFERFGSRGVAQFERCVAGCREAGALVLADVKRGDIGSTMAAYAQAYLDPQSTVAVDAITVSPYLGVGALEPSLRAGREVRPRRIRDRVDLEPGGAEHPARPARTTVAPLPSR